MYLNHCNTISITRITLPSILISLKFPPPDDAHSLVKRTYIHEPSSNKDCLQRISIPNHRTDLNPRSTRFFKQGPRYPLPGLINPNFSQRRGRNQGWKRPPGYLWTARLSGPLLNSSPWLSKQRPDHNLRSNEYQVNWEGGRSQAIGRCRW